MHLRSLVLRTVAGVVTAVAAALPLGALAVATSASTPATAIEAKHQDTVIWQ